MKKGKTILILGGLAAAAIYGYRLYDAGKKLVINWGFPNLNPKKNIFGGVWTIGLPLTFKNPVKQQLKITDLNAVIRLPNGKRLAEIKNFSVDIYMGTVSRVIYIKVPLLEAALNIGDSLLRGLMSGILPTSVRIEGQMKVNGLSVMVNENVTAKS